VAALAAQCGKRLSTYTIGSPFGNEFGPAAEVACWLHSRHHEMVMTAEDLQALLPGLIAALETWDPVTLQIAAPVAYLYRQLMAPGTVVLTGYGADLIFAGVADASLPEEPLECEILAAVRRTVPTNEFSPAYAADHGVTVRYPFWSPAMLSTALSIRARLKVRDGAVKHVFRTAAEAWVPREIAWRSKLGIHEGSAMHRMFDECLGVRGLAAQSRALHEIAGRVLLPPGAQRRAGQESAICASS
jgi:carbapenam-3-carboxylate synthase